MNKKYNLKLDLQFRCNNSTMKFNQFDNNTSDFFMRITNGGNLVDIEKAIVVLAVIKPSGKVASQFIEVKNGLVYVDLKPNMKDEIGTYTAQAMLILEDERVVTDSISYEVEEDKIFSLLNDTVEDTEEFTLLADMLSRLSTVEINEEQRVINEAERILSEENRKIEEAKRVEAELIRQHEEADRAKYDAIRESNENTRKQNESIRLANETNRIDEETKRVEEENKRKLAEEERNANYNFMTEDEERRRSEANAHKEAEALRVQAETNRVNEEAKRRTTEQARVSAENTRVNNENTREASEVVRKNNETQRVEAETQRQNRYNSFIADAEVNANNFENYTNSAKVKEEERKSNELNRKSQEDRRASNEVERISNENARKANEAVREKNETSRQYVFENKVDEIDKKIIEINATKDNFVSSVNTKVDNKISEIDSAKSDMTTTVSNKVNEVETRFNALTSKQQQDAEVIDARDGETSLKARLDRDIEKAKQVYVNVEGSNISTDSSSGYLKDVEILGNTIQDASNLADIRSVGDKVEGQELYEIPVLIRGKNLFNGKWERGYVLNLVPSSPLYGKLQVGENYSTTQDFIKVSPNEIYYFTNTSAQRWVIFYDKDKNPISHQETWGSCTTPNNTAYIRFYDHNTRVDAFPNYSMSLIDNVYEPYIEDKLTILSPVQLEKVGDVADRIIEKDGVWGVEKHIKTDLLKGGSDEGFGLNKALPKGGYQFTWFANMGATANKNSEVISSTMNSYVVSNEEYSSNIWIYDGVTYVIHHPTISTADEIKLWLQANPTIVKFALNTPQFIPLPHNQQIKLRTFANKTNISFGCEIEGTIKAQVPKSLGATVNTHTEQINNLNKELDRVKKLEESTVSTVTTESDFTTVEQTSNGYFEDVKLEGKTLVNLAKQPTNNGSINNQYATISTVTNIKPSTEYTYIIRNNGSETLKLYLNTNGGFDWFDLDVEVNSTVIGKARTLPTIDGDIWLSLSKAETIEQNLQVVLLEGDHTQNPPSFFEGLKSVGQSATTSDDGVDEIVVSSVKGDGNLLMPLHTGVTTGSYDKNNITFSSDYSMSYIANDWGQGVSVDVIGVVKGETYVILCDTNTNMCIRGTNALNTTGDIQIRSNKAEIVATSTGIGTIEFKNATETSNVSCTNLRVIKKGFKEEFSVLNQDKKHLLYYNNETQAWEKPILREWDSIEKHANGKYYYHQRSGEVVLNGSEGFYLVKTTDNTIVFGTDLPKVSINVLKMILSDKFNFIGDDNFEQIRIGNSGRSIFISILKSKLPTQDMDGFKQWLQANNVTAVYKLAEEKVYECTNIDLITYNGETNYVVESGVLSPKTTLKVHSNISNVVSLLQKKVSLLESNIKASQEVQDMMILETDMRMLDIELALMEFIPMTLNLGGSNMLRSATYFNFLKNHIINETYEKEYLENVMNKYLATGRINQDEYNELYKMLYPPVYDIELPIEY